MTEHTETEAVGLLILTRLLAGGDKGATKAQVQKDLEPLLNHRWTGAPLSELLERTLSEFESSGLLSRTRGKSDRSVLTAQGRQQGLDLLGLGVVPPKATWATLKKTFLLARALGLPSPSGETVKRFSSDTGFKAALLKTRYELPLDDYPTLPKATDALAWKLLGFESPCPSKLTLKAVLAALFSRALGDPHVADPKKAVDKLLSQKVKARRDIAKEFREAALRQWVDRALVGRESSLEGSVRVAGAESSTPRRLGSHENRGILPQPPTANRGGPSLSEPFDLRTFSDRALAAARSCRDGRFGEHKVFIAHLWRALEADPAFVGMDFETFQRRLGEANQARLLDLARADLVEAMDEKDVRDSETRFLGATFHFVRI